MPDYKAIFGKKIKFLTTDLTMSTATEGELFYSDTNKEFKVGVKLTAWSSGGNLGAATGGCRSCGTLPAGLTAFGRVSGSGVAESWEYDGSSWTAGGDANTARAYLAGCGTQTAAIYAVGNPSTSNSEEYDGSSWAEGDNANTARWYAASAGTQTAAVMSL